MVDETAKILGFDRPAINKPPRKIHFMKGMLIERKTVMNRARRLSLATPARL
jgi:hypothetical protein